MCVELLKHKGIIINKENGNIKTMVEEQIESDIDWGGGGGVCGIPTILSNPFTRGLKQNDVVTTSQSGEINYGNWRPGYPAGYIFSSFRDFDLNMMMWKIDKKFLPLWKHIELHQNSHFA